MSSQSLEITRNRLLYDPSQLPEANLNTFLKAVELLRYEWVEIEHEGTKQYHLDSPWKSEIGLETICRDFQRSFFEHLVESSISGSNKAEYQTTLSECKAAIRDANLRFVIPHTKLLIIASEFIEGPELPSNYDALPENYQTSIYRCYVLLGLLFKQLEEGLKDEMDDYRHRNHVLAESKYEWTGNKNDISQLSLALFLSGCISRKGTGTLKETTLARDLAAFFGVESLTYDQNIENLTTRKKKPWDFLSNCTEKLRDYFIKKGAKPE